MAEGVLNAARTVVALGIALIPAYLLLLTLVAMVLPPPRVPPGAARRRFAILVPAHDEELTIARLLVNLHALDYPAHRFAIWVVADNCTDATSSLARAGGAHVLERFDPAFKAKGYALQSLLDHLRTQALRYDAYVVLDADSIVAPNFLRSMDAHLEAGSAVIQAYYSVLNANQSAVAGLRFAALAAIHYVRPRARAALRLSVGLKGNGMCFAAPVIERFGWRWFGLTEDVEFHMALVQAGVRVDFAGDTSVLADMPATLSQSATQHARWEQGRLAVLHTHVPGLLRSALRERSLIALDAALEQLVPPLSIVFAASLAGLAVGVLFGSGLVVAVSVTSLFAVALHLCASLMLVRAPASAYRSLAYAPMYIAWKVGAYVRAARAPRGNAWVRTARALNRD